MTQPVSRIGMNNYLRKGGRFRAVPYPKYTGTEPCTTIPPEYFYQEDMPDDQRVGYAVMREMCRTCPIVNECLTWALHREKYGFWAGTTQAMRTQLRKELNIAVCDPEYINDYLLLQADIDRQNEQKAGNGNVPTQREAS